MGLLDRLNEEKKTKSSGRAQVSAGRSLSGDKFGGTNDVQIPTSSPYYKLKRSILDRIIEEFDNEKIKDLEPEEQRNVLGQYVEEMMEGLAKELSVPYNAAMHKATITEILDEVLGLGPIERFMRDEDVSEIMVNGPDMVYIERKGKLTLSDIKFENDDHVMRIIEKIVAPLGRRIDESSPLVDARTKDGSRVNAIIPPLALNGPVVTIRKFKKDPLQVSDLVRFGTLSEEMAIFLEACVKIHLNIVISGGTGSGKTTTLNIMSSFIPEDERIITVEDAAELQLRQPHVVRLETRPPNIEGKGAITMRDLIKNTLRMRPDRIVVGEVRGGEALDMLQAMNTGHDGSLTTGHANSPRDMISRLETMVMMSGMDLPQRAIREQIASAVHLIVQQNRLKDGSRKITHITEVQGMEGEVVVLQDIFHFNQKGVDDKGKIIGTLEPTGIRPKFMHRFEEEGIKLPQNLFVKSGGW
jgi:pilus assembly protein CpaF